MSLEFVKKSHLLLGTNTTMSEYACLAVSNLCLSDKLTIPILMQLDAAQNLINLTKTSSDSVQEAAFQVQNKSQKIKKVPYIFVYHA